MGTDGMDRPVGGWSCILAVVDAVSGPTEPSADLRAMASTLWQTFVALQQEGFSESQALKIIGEIIAGMMPRGD